MFYETWKDYRLKKIIEENKKRYLVNIEHKRKALLKKMDDDQELAALQTRLGKDTLAKPRAPDKVKKKAKGRNSPSKKLKTIKEEWDSPLESSDTEEEKELDLKGPYKVQETIN
jgi:hypothetical protein